MSTHFLWQSYDLNRVHFSINLLNEILHYYCLSEWVLLVGLCAHVSPVLVTLLGVCALFLTYRCRVLNAIQPNSLAKREHL